jgi:hypothetical protein
MPLLFGDELVCDDHVTKLLTKFLLFSILYGTWNCMLKFRVRQIDQKE